MTMLVANMQGFAHADIRSVGLQPILGAFELVFDLQLRTVTPDPAYEAQLHGAAVAVVGAQGAFVRLGQARPSAPLRVRTAPNGVTLSCELRLPIAAVQVAALEELRDSGDLQIKLTVAGEGGPLAHPEWIYDVSGDLVARVSRSAWIGLVNDAQAMDILLLEVPMPFVGAPPAGREMMSALRTAQRLFAEGNYSECVVRCRTALEALAALTGRGQGWVGAALAPLEAKRQAMTKDERQMVLEAALLHFTHLGAHPNEVQISRRDAKLALSMTASILAYRTG